MYSKELLFDEDEFIRIYKEESTIAIKNGASFFRHNFLINTDENSGANIKSYLADIKRAVNFIYNTAFQAISPRFVTIRSGNDTVIMVHESIGAHTMIMEPIYLGFRDVLKNHYFSTPEDVFLEAIRIHDLPENAFGDIPDNGCAEHDHGNKEELEQELMLEYRNYVPRYRLNTFNAALKLLDSKKELKTIDSRVFYLDDKIAAILLPLTAYQHFESSFKNYEHNDHEIISANFYPRIYFDFAHADKIASREREELKIIRGTRNPSVPVPAFELWTADFLEVRKMTTLDDYGYFTALLIAYTLACRGEWYSWREHTYEEFHRTNN